MSGFEINKIVGALLMAILLVLSLSLLVELVTDGEHAESKPVYVVGSVEEEDASVEVTDEEPVEEMAADEKAEAVEALEDVAEAVEAAVEGGGEEIVEAVSDAASSLIAAIMAADLTAGEKAFKKCKVCHSLDEGGSHKVGPNLWGVVGAPIGRHTDFKYSGALIGVGGTWDYASLDAFLTKPNDFMAGTKMVFPGVKKAENRAAVIAYLRSNAAASAPLIQ